MKAMAVIFWVLLLLLLPFRGALNIDSAFSIFILGIFGVIYFIFSYLPFQYHSIFFLFIFCDVVVRSKDALWGTHIHTRKTQQNLYIFIEFHFSFFGISFSLFIWMSNNVLEKRNEKINEAGIDIEYFITNKKKMTQNFLTSLTSLCFYFHFQCRILMI